MTKKRLIDIIELEILRDKAEIIGVICRLKKDFDEKTSNLYETLDYAKILQDDLEDIITKREFLNHLKQLD